MKRITVVAGRAPYDVVVGPGVLARGELKACLGAGASGIVISSRRVMDLHGARLHAALAGAGFATRQTLLLADGEAGKTSSQWERAMAAMAKAKLDRSSFVIAFGGGSVGDAAGFAAATYMRGIRFIQIPTTLLSMVDSSVGGKTGINLAEGKNLVGSFHQPSLVLADLTFLKTLPRREHQSGVYEILKAAFLRSSALLALLERTRGLRRASDADLERAIATSIAIKARVVESDERETGDRVLLNLGHTVGHALEAATAYRVFTHGEGVGYGMEFAVDLSEEMGLLKEAAAKRMRRAITQVGPKTPLPPKLIAQIKTATLSDKKRDGARLKEILLKGVGRPLIHTLNAHAFARLTEAWLVSRLRRRSA
ncbi:MAG: 3-dehydroquinate synthase [Vicinamibacteria bacterium]